MTKEDIKALAWDRGYRRVISMSGGCNDLTLWVKPDEDLDSRFPCYCAETGDRLHVNGWLFALNDGAEDRASLYAEYGDFREAV